MATEIKENYLKAIYFLDQKDGDITLTALAKEMQLSKPTVNDMVKKLKIKGWIIYEKYKPLKEKADQISTLANDFNSYLETLKGEMTATVDDPSDYEIMDKGDYLEILGGSDDGSNNWQKLIDQENKFKDLDKEW